MSIKTLISVAVLLGSSTAALAQPAAWSRSQPTPIVRDHRMARPAWSRHSTDARIGYTDVDDVAPLPPPTAAEPCGLHTVASFDDAFDTRDQGAITIDVGRYGIPSRKLIVTSNGNSEVFSVLVYYTDGTSHFYSWNHLFNAPTSDGQAGSQLVMGGTGKPISRIVLDGYNSWNTQMSVQILS